MVRTRRSIEEENRVMLVSGPGMDSFLADEDVAKLIEGEAIQEMLVWATDVARRVLVVGLEDRGRIALELARRKLFVTVVEPDESLLDEFWQKVESEGCSGYVTRFVSDYMKRDFQPSGFDLAVFFSVLSRYNEPLVVLKKAARELRAGGRVFARIRVRPDMTNLRTRVAPLVAKIDRVERLAGLRSMVQRKASGLADSVPTVAHLTTLPEAGAFLTQVGEIFKIDRHEQRHLFGPVIGWLSTCSRIPEPARNLASGMLQIVDRIDGVIVKSEGTRHLATHLYIYGLKELGLGHTFRV